MTAPARGVQQAVGARIRAQRQTLGWTTYQLADKAGVSQPTITQWETGSRNMTAWRLDHLAQVLGTTAAALLGSRARPETRCWCGHAHHCQPGHDGEAW